MADRFANSARVSDLNSDRVVEYVAIPNDVDYIIREGPAVDSDAYMAAVEKLGNAIVFYKSNIHLPSCEGALAQAKNLLSMAMEQFLVDFTDLLGSSSCFVDPDELRERLMEEANEPWLPEVLMPDAIDPLTNFSSRMIEYGEGVKCITAYREIRSKALQQNLEQLGFESLTDVDDMPWDDLAVKIREWIIQFKIAVKFLIPAERDACNTVMRSLEELCERCFSDVAGGSLLSMLRFGEMVAESPRKPEKLFSLLDMYECMLNLKPEIDSLFNGYSSQNIKRCAITLNKSLATAVQDTFDEFETQIENNGTEDDAQPQEAMAAPQQEMRRGFFRFARHEEARGAQQPQPKGVPPDGGVLPLASYVVNYIKFYTSSDLEYARLLRSVYREENPSKATGGSLRARKVAGITAKLLLALQKNLSYKARLYREPALMELFLTNNFNYMCNGIQNSAAGELLGTAWVNRHWSIVQHHKEAYISAALKRVERAIGDTTSMDTLNRRFKNFNDALDELYQKQRHWVVPDRDVAESLRAGLSRRLLEIYSPFLDSNRDTLRNAPQVFLVHSTDAVAAMMMEAFVRPASAGSFPRSTSPSHW